MNTKIRQQNVAIYSELFEAGYKLIPLRGKIPTVKRWQNRRDSYRPNFLKGKNAGIVCGPSSGILVLDIDDNNLFQNAKTKNGWKLLKTYKVKTGSGGYHYYFQYPKNGKTYGNKSFQSLGFDIRGDGGQVVAESSIHPETQRTYSRANGSPSKIRQAPKWLLDLYENKENDNSDIIKLRISSYIKDLIINPTRKGERSEAEITVLNALVGIGISDQDIEDIVFSNPIGERAKEKGVDHLREQIRRAREYVVKNNVEPCSELPGDILEKLASSSTDFLENKTLLPPRYLVKPIIREQSLSMVFAPAGMGKSWFVHTLALALTRREYRDIEIGTWQVTRPCSVLLIDGEMPAGLLQERIRALAVPMGDENPEKPFLIFTSEEVSQATGFQVNLSNEEWRNRINTFLDNHPEIKLLILDNISSLVPGGDENTKASWDPVNQWLLKLRRSGVAVLLVHHASKAGGYRGHSGRIDNLDNVIQLSPKGNSDEVNFEVKLVKSRALKPGEGKPFGLQLVEWEEDSGGLVWKEAHHAADRKREIQLALLEGTRPQKEMANEFDISPGRLSQIKKELKERGLINDKGAITNSGKDYYQQLKHEFEIEEEDD